MLKTLTDRRANENGHDLPAISESDIPNLIDGFQNDLKPCFVEQKMMIGVFHERNPIPGSQKSQLISDAQSIKP